MSPRVRRARGFTSSWPAIYCWAAGHRERGRLAPHPGRRRIALIIAIAFLGIVLAKISSIALWIVVLIGVALMVVSVGEAVRSGEDQFGGR
jgi:hypothetical protein